MRETARSLFNLARHVVQTFREADNVTGAIVVISGGALTATAGAVVLVHNGGVAQSLKAAVNSVITLGWHTGTALMEYPAQIAVDVVVNFVVDSVRNLVMGITTLIPAALAWLRRIGEQIMLACFICLIAFLVGGVTFIILAGLL